MRKSLCLLVALWVVQLAQAAYWKDITSTYITNASLVSTDGWTQNFTEGQAFVRASYAGWSNVDVSTSYCYQSVTLPAGIYKLTGYAFFRYGRDVFSTTVTNDITTGYMYAGTDTTRVANLYGTGYSSSNTYADKLSEADTAFYTNNHYLNELEFTVSSDDTEINIGYSATFSYYGSWFVCGVMNLYLYSSNSEAYDSLAELIEICEGYYNNSSDITDGARSTLYSAISTAKSSLSSSSTDDDALTSAYETLEAARQTFVKAAYPTNGTTFDMTFLISNNSFETGDMTGWSYYTSGYDTGVRSTSSTTYAMGKSDGDYLFNTWNSSSMDFILEGLITSLPEGYYTLTAVLASDNDNTMTLYAGSNTTTVTTTGSINGIESEVSFCLTSTQGITFGVTSSSWYKADNFQLLMTGSYSAYLTDRYNGIDQDSLNTAVKDSLTSAYSNLQTALKSNSNSSPAYASEYSSVTYTVDANGESVTPEDNTTTITVTDNSDGTYNLAMSNVKLALSITISNSTQTDTITISNISLSNITGYNVNGMLYLEYDGDLTVSLKDTKITYLVSISLVNSSATLPITLALRMNEENIYGSVVITDLDDAISLSETLLDLFGIDVDDYEPATITFGSYFSASSSTSTDALSTAVKNFEDAATLSEAFIADAYEDYQGVLELIELCESYAENSTPDSDDIKTTFTTAISTAKTNVEAALNDEDVQEVETVLEAARQTYVKNAYPTNDITFDMNFLFADTDFSDISAWSGSSENAQTNVVEFYAGYWSLSTTYMARYQSVTLPDGKYTLSGYGWYRKGEQNTTPSDSVFGSMFAGTDTIALNPLDDSSASYSNAYDSYFSQDKYCLSLDFSNTEDGATVDIGYRAWFDTMRSWACVGPISLVMTGAPEASDYYSTLQTLIETATAMSTVNVGTATFQIPETAKTTLETAITTAKTYTESNSATELQAAITALQAAIDTYEAAELNAPGEDEHMKITANTEGFTYNNKPVTFYYNSATSGSYALTWGLAASDNYAQAFSFHAVSSTEETDYTNVYTISFTDSLGREHYICTSLTGYSDGSYYQIRTTETESAALKVKVLVSHETEGLWYLYNTEASDYLGSNGDAGFFTSSSYYGLALSTASQASVALSITSASNYYATLILPFQASIPDGLEVYEITSTKASNDEGVTTLVYTQVESTITANTPYLVYASDSKEFSHTFADYGVAAQDQYAGTYMGGTLVSITAIEGTYVLQKHDDYGVAFYVVKDTKPTVGAYRAYVNALSSSEEDSEANSRVVLISAGDEEGDDDATAISSVQTTDSAAAVRVYSLSGVLVSDGLSESEAMQSLPQGIYIINGAKRLVR